MCWLLPTFNCLMFSVSSRPPTIPFPERSGGIWPGGNQWQIPVGSNPVYSCPVPFHPILFRFAYTIGGGGGGCGNIALIPGENSGSAKMMHVCAVLVGPESENVAIPGEEIPHAQKHVSKTVRLTQGGHPSSVSGGGNSGGVSSWRRKT